MEWFNLFNLNDVLLFLEFHQDLVLHVMPLVILIMVFYNLSFVEPESQDHGGDYE
jgi:hypothetical protein